MRHPNETGKQQRMMMHWTDYIRFFPSAAWIWLKDNFDRPTLR